MPLNHLRIVCGDLQENCYIVWQEDRNECIVFDPGADAHVLREEIVGRKLSVAAFLLTHCHGDHIGALAPMKASFPDAPIYCPELEVEWLAKPTLNLSYFLGHAITAPPPEKIVRDNDVIELAGLSFKAIHIPGHSPGGTAYYLQAEGKEHPHVFCGDILFAGSIGRTDLPGGTGEDVLVSGIRERLFILPDTTMVHPGHGELTWIGDEKDDNPLCGGRAG